MSSRSLPVLLQTLCCAASRVLAAEPESATPGGASNPVAPTPASLNAAVEFALRMELEGRNTDRTSLLLKVLEDDPEHAAAHWHLGQIKVGELWLPYDRVIHEDGDRWHRLYLYRQNRDQRGDTVDDHFYLADGARQRGMWDEERSHLLRIVELDWNNPEARQRLGDVKIDGGWVSRAEIEEFLKGLSQTRQNLERWFPTVEPIVKRMFRSRQRAWMAAREELASIRDPSAIPAVETAMANGDQRAAEWYLDWLSNLSAWEASVALARQAAMSPSPALRARAQLLLREKRIDDYGQPLLAGMRGEPEMVSRLFITPGGGMMYVQHIAYETQADVRTRDLAVIYGPENIVSLNGVPLHAGGPGSPITTGGTPEAVIQHLRSYYGATSSFESRAGTANAQVDSDRLVRAFASSINHEELESAAECWEWWIDYQQVFAGEKPLNAESYEETWAVDRQRGYWVQVPDRLRYFSSFPSVRAAGSCLSAGTPVITEYGPKRIDEIRLGDRVLAQSVETGEIAFKPVLKTTVRPPVDFLRITTKSTELLCTPGHPFWVNGHDWLYARELQTGMRFHSIAGAEEIVEIQDAEREEQAYNLIVADFHTYFAGEARVLSHDNTPRNPTNALVPGLMPDWSVPAEDDVVADN